MRAPSFSTWTAEHKRLILNDRAQGMKMRDLRLKYHHAEGTLRRFFESADVAVAPCALKSLTKPLSEPKKPAPDVAFEQKQQALCNFAPMLTVDIRTGKVLLNRLDEVLSRNGRGGIEGRY